MAPLTNGDRVVVPTDLNAGSMPGNTSKNVFYWVVNVSGETFEVSTTEGGAGIDLSSDGTANLIAYWRPTWAGSPVWYTADPENYLPMGISALCLMEFLGVTGVSAARQALEPFQLADFEAGWFSSGTYSAPGFKMLPS